MQATRQVVTHNALMNVRISHDLNEAAHS